MGVTADRHDFIDDAIKHGASAVVVSKDIKKVRYSPDMAFTFKNEKIRKEKKSIGISIIDLLIRDNLKKSISEDMKNPPYIPYNIIQKILKEIDDHSSISLPVSSDNGDKLQFVKYIYSDSKETNSTVKKLVEDNNLELITINTMHSIDGGITNNNESYITVMNDNLELFKKELMR